MNGILVAVMGATASMFALTEAPQAAYSESPDRAVRTLPQLVQLADARAYRHCHNIHHRTYCHKADRLPMNWPPFSDRAAPKASLGVVSREDSDRTSPRNR